MNELQEDANNLFDFLMQYLFSIFLQYNDIILQSHFEKQCDSFKFIYYSSSISKFEGSLES